MHSFNRRITFCSKSGTALWAFLNKRRINASLICDNIDSAMIEGSGSLVDVAKDLRIKE